MTEQQYPQTVYGVALDDAGSTDYYDTETEARAHAQGDTPLVRVVTTLLDERPVLTTDEPLNPNDATHTEFERQEQELFRHQPVMSREGGGIIGCQCLDRFFYRKTEDWGTHLALVMRGLAHPSVPTREQIAEASAEVLRDVAYVCGRVWEAWQVGTMSEDDFAPAWEDDELTFSIADAVLALLQKGGDRG